MNAEAFGYFIGALLVSALTAWAFYRWQQTFDGALFVFMFVFFMQPRARVR
jgi:ABC-type glycerol-3-phosphate transport system permease component